MTTFKLHGRAFSLSRSRHPARPWRLTIEWTEADGRERVVDMFLTAEELPYLAQLLLTEGVTP
jgi:hypothetical protein